MQSLLLILLICSAEMSDFELGENAYNKKQYSMAEAYFEAELEQDPRTEHRADILYYLFQIHIQERDIPHILSVGSQFLSDYPQDQRSKLIFNSLVHELSRQQAFGIVAEYVKEFDYLITDQAIIESTAGELIARKQFALAESLLQSCAQTDTVKLMRAFMAEDFSEKEVLYSSMPDTKAQLYLTELYLEHGDTLGAYEVFRTITQDGLQSLLLFRYARISRLFDAEGFKRAIDHLHRTHEYKNKARLLWALETGQLSGFDVPRDQIEYSLFAQYVKQDTISRQPPEHINVDSLLADSFAMVSISTLREDVNNFFLDSVYTDMLLNSGRWHDAYQTIGPYIKYQNTEKYARIVRAIHYYYAGFSERAALDIVLSRVRTPEFLYMLANSFKRLQRESGYLYREVVDKSRDSTLVNRASRELIKLAFDEGRYADVLKYRFEIVEGDTQLVKLYAYSLARNGHYDDATMLTSQYSIEMPYTLTNYYGEYLIEDKQYSQARTLYDSVIAAGDGRIPSRMYYNWALVPFLQGRIDTASGRFLYYIETFKNSEDYDLALFKLATALYVKELFDTAAYYYERASHDDSLRYDALRNQLICLKKALQWIRAAEVGSQLLHIIPGGEKHEIQFETGYALLRAGNVRKAIEHLKTAVALKPTHEYAYWLAEAYLSKGEFVRALYHFQRIVDVLEYDDMWTPTAQYKTGVVLEFLEETAEARNVYERIIKKRGRSDTWGIEAQKRLDELNK